MSDLLLKLGERQRKGSERPCHWLTHETPSQVAVGLTKLIEPWGSVAPTHRWVPKGFDDAEEAADG